MGRGMIPYDPDFYMRGEMEFGRSHEETFSCLPVEKTSTALSVIEIKPDKVLRVAEIQIEDIGDDLMADVKTKSFNEISTVSKWDSSNSYRSNKAESMYFDNDINQDKEGNQTIEVDSYLLESDMPRWGAGVWSLFSLHGLSLMDSHICRVLNGSKRYIKVCHTFKVRVNDKDTAPYIQLMCNAQRVKYLSGIFKDGDIITLFVRHDFMPRLPSPPIISIQPHAEQTFVPLLPKQRLQIITDGSQSELEFRFGVDSSLRFMGRQEIDRERSKKLGSNIRCDFFECLSSPKTQELVFVNGKLEQKSKTVSIPMMARVAKDKRFPVIVDPVRKSVIYASNIDGFILRSHRNIDLKVEPGVGIRLVYKMEKDDYNETKVAIIKPQPFFVLERIGAHWLIRNH